MTGDAIIWWVRRDLRLSDNPALCWAAEQGGPVLPVFVRDAAVDGLGAAPKWRLGLGVEALGDELAERGSRLTLRTGPALETLRAVIAETGARTVVWNRLYDPEAVARDTEVKAALKSAGLTVHSFGGHLLFEPWTVQTKTGAFYKVYTPMWKAVKDREVDAPSPAPRRLEQPPNWPAGEAFADWNLGHGMRRGADVVRRHIFVGEAAAQDRLGQFIAEGVGAYDRRRDLPAEDGTSRLSAALSLGEIGPRTCWHAGRRAREEGKPGAETFLKELVWREFAYHLMHHTPRLLTDNWREEWAAFPWKADPAAPEVLAWQQGRTGLRFVDAAMREMYVTGTMHNRGRMIVASVLTKHLMCHWKIGMDWFADCLVDWDPASNAMGWQWSAGSGPDATPYFRVFNPVTQLDKFDPQRVYASRWIAEGKSNPAPEALDYFAAIPKAWGLTASAPYVPPIVTPEAGRARALDAYQNRGF